MVLECVVLMTDLGVVLLGLCGGIFSACSGLLTVMFFVADMVYNAEGVGFIMQFEFYYS